MGTQKDMNLLKNFYGINAVTKLECIGHVQKRVGGRLRQLKKTTKGLGGKNKLTDKLIDRIQNYYGITIRSNVGNLQKMMSSVIAAFFHCVSGKNNSLHGQCPEGSESWCRYQRAKAAGSPLKEIQQGLPNKIINQIKPTYLKLCNETLLKKCLHGTWGCAIGKKKKKGARCHRPKFEGPYRVIERFSKVSYRVQHVEQLRKRFNTHVNRMIPFIKRFSYLHLNNLDDLQPDETEAKGIVPSPRYNLRARAGNSAY
ncbi:uncharacterized protein LOC101238613 [Trichonephila clavipes]|nr:uncharacterized protein LOC101238613 [Trichonephila clavipes]